MVARKKREDELARKFADQMGMGDVGRKTGIAGAAKRTKLIGGKASPLGFCALFVFAFLASAGHRVCSFLPSRCSAKLMVPPALGWIRMAVAD